MTEKEYRNHPAISRSELWKIKESPEKFKYYKDNPVKPTPSLIFGQALHKIVLETADFFKDFEIMPEFNRRTKEGKSAYDDFMSRNADKTVISEDVFTECCAMMQAIDKNNFCRQLLAGQKEVPFFWVDELTGEQCKCRADCITRINDINYIIDLKTTANADTSEFMKKSIDYGYHVQAAMYTEGVKANIGGECQFIFIAIEKEPPYSINIMQCSEIYMKYGYDDYRHLLGLYHECKEENNWYGYLGKYNDINSIGLPSWIAKEYEKG